MTRVDYQFHLLREPMNEILYLERDDVVNYLRKLAIENTDKIDAIKHIIKDLESLTFPKK